MRCSLGHSLREHGDADEELTCDGCGGAVPMHAVRYSCDVCDYDLCESCSLTATPTAPQQASRWPLISFEAHGTSVAGGPVADAPVQTAFERPHAKAMVLASTVGMRLVAWYSDRYGQVVPSVGTVAYVDSPGFFVVFDGEPEQTGLWLDARDGTPTGHCESACRPQLSRAPASACACRLVHRLGVVGWRRRGGDAPALAKHGAPMA